MLLSKSWCKKCDNFIGIKNIKNIDQEIGFSLILLWTLGSGIKIKNHNYREIGMLNKGKSLGYGFLVN
jgi:hypothetical protein